MGVFYTLKSKYIPKNIIQAENIFFIKASLETFSFIMLGNKNVSDIPIAIA